LYLLHVFQLAFSSQERRKAVFAQMHHWEEQSHLLPEDVQDFDWRRFQQEYRDYIDVAKMAQLVPGIGAVVGFIANYQLMERLGKTAMNAYRMRWIEEGKL
ncbi:MAG: EcsC family protein, partial [Sphingobacteriales bacterium]